MDGYKNSKQNKSVWINKLTLDLNIELYYICSSINLVLIPIIMICMSKIYTLIKQHHKTAQMRKAVHSYNTDSYTSPQFGFKLISKLFKYLDLCTLLA